MRLAFRALPNTDVPRPVAELKFPSKPGLVLPVLVDSGALAVRVPFAFGALLGIDVLSGAVETIGLGGSFRSARVVTLPLKMGHWTWSADVAFVEGLNSHGVVGLAGFFDRFRVSFDGEREEFEVSRARHRPG